MTVPKPKKDQIPSQKLQVAHQDLERRNSTCSSWNDCFENVGKSKYRKFKTKQRKFHSSSSNWNNWNFLKLNIDGEIQPVALLWAGLQFLLKLSTNVISHSWSNRDLKEITETKIILIYFFANERLFKATLMEKILVRVKWKSYCE